MNAVVGYHEEEMSYAVDFGRDREPIKKRSRHPDYRRKGTGPARVNGIHCRRSKRWTWGSGRGARMLNLRAFASCLALAMASITAAAMGGVLDSTVFVTINDTGNAGNTTSGTSGPSSPSGLGAVSSIYRLANKETTNAQYVDFLNAVDANGTNPRGVYNTSMASGNGGIAFNSGAAAGAKYSVRSGAPAGAPGGTTFANMPVNYVSWFSAARFMNWLNAGQISGTAATVAMDGSLPTAAYVVGSATSGNIVARTANPQYYLPSYDEWYKAAFYRPTGSLYTLYQTNTNSAPTATVSNFTLANSGNFGGATTSPIQVGSYTNSMSAYGLYDMLGNVTEMTDGSVGGLYRAMGGGYSAAAASWNATAAAITKDGGFTNVSYGFRVAAVPEPGTIALAGVGIAGLFGLDWMKRRKKRQVAARHEA